MKKKNVKIFNESMRVYDFRREQVNSVEDVVWELLSGRKNPLLSEARALVEYIDYLYDEICDDVRAYAVFETKSEILRERLKEYKKAVEKVINGKFTLEEMSWGDPLTYDPFKK